MTGSARVIRGNALALPLADESVDLVVTSPPYFGLRSYSDREECERCILYRREGRDLEQAWPDHAAHVQAEHKPSHYPRQLGAEATPGEFVDALIAATAEMVRVLKPSGSIFVNLGDKYVADNRGSGGDRKRGDAKFAPAGPAGYVGEGIIARKSLMGLPWRYAIRCIDDLGLILRAEIIWSKPNGLPESVIDRVRRSHETWFHLTKEPRYYSTVDEIREAYALGTAARYASGYKANSRTTAGQQSSPSIPIGVDDLTTNPLGKLPGSVWDIPTQPLQVPAHLGIDHFAAFPLEWPRRIIAGWSPPGICTGCGEGRRPVSTVERSQASMALRRGSARGYIGAAQGQNRESGVFSITGYACACPDVSAPTTPAVVLDPFAGTGTTMLAAKALGRTGVGVDMSGDYCRLAAWRTSDPGELARAMGVPKPPVEVPGQGDLFGGAA